MSRSPETHRIIYQVSSSLRLFWSSPVGFPAQPTWLSQETLLAPGRLQLGEDAPLVPGGRPRCRCWISLTLLSVKTPLLESPGSSSASPASCPWFGDAPSFPARSGCARSRCSCGPAPAASASPPGSAGSSPASRPLHGHVRIALLPVTENPLSRPCPGSCSPVALWFFSFGYSNPSTFKKSL